MKDLLLLRLAIALIKIAIAIAISTQAYATAFALAGLDMPKRKWPFEAKCCQAGCSFTANGSTEVAARNGLSRHMRERHRATDNDPAHRRRTQQSSRLRLARASQPMLLQGQVEQHLFFVTCPLRREDMFTSTRDRLVAAGVAVESIMRRRGIDFATVTENPHRYPVGLKRSTFLMWDFHKNFLPSCQTWFDTRPELQFIWWVEDDCKLKPKIKVTSLHAHALAEPACLHWAGFAKVRGIAKWGTHLFALSRTGLPLVQAQLDKEESEVPEGTANLSYLMGLDTWFHKRRDIVSGELPLVRAWPESMASQVNHSRQGRR